MFEALFILTTIDAGTRVARFLVGEFLGRVYAPFGRHDWMPGAMSRPASSWRPGPTSSRPAASHHLADVRHREPAAGVVALAVGTTVIVNAGRARYAWVTLLPLSFVSITTLTAGAISVRDNFYPMAIGPDRREALPGISELDRHGRDDGLRAGDPVERDHALGWRAEREPEAGHGVRGVAADFTAGATDLTDHRGSAMDLTENTD